MFDDRVSLQIKNVPIPVGLQSRLLAAVQNSIQTENQTAAAPAATKSVPRPRRSLKTWTRLTLAAVAITILAGSRFLFWQPAEVESKLAYNQIRENLVKQFTSISAEDFAQLQPFDNSFAGPAADRELSGWQFGSSIGVNLNLTPDHEAVVSHFTYRKWSGTLIAVPTAELEDLPPDAQAGSGQQVVEWRSADKSMAYICIVHKGRASELLQSVLGGVA